VADLSLIISTRAKLRKLVAAQKGVHGQFTVTRTAVNGTLTKMVTFTLFGAEDEPFCDAVVTGLGFSG
jgi:hypothetical protein